MSVMHASPWRPNIPREAIKQNSKITWLSYMQRIWQTFCNIYLMVKLCIAKFHFLNLNIQARLYAGSRHHGVAGPVSQVARVRWGFLKDNLARFWKDHLARWKRAVNLTLCILNISSSTQKSLEHFDPHLAIEPWHCVTGPVRLGLLVVLICALSQATIASGEPPVRLPLMSECRIQRIFETSHTIYLVAKIFIVTQQSP